MPAATPKYQWRKREKEFYLPQLQPEVIAVPAFKFLTLAGEGNPNDELFAEAITALYSLAYGIKMTAKKPDRRPAGYHDYTVYPLEGEWDLNEEGRKKYAGTINKNDLVFTLMIRQPDFVETSFFEEIRQMVMKRKPQPLLGEVRFEEIAEGKCVQMLHVGPYDDEPASFRRMEGFATGQGLERASMRHREIYLSDFRKTAPEKLKTVLRFQVSPAS